MLTISCTSSDVVDLEACFRARSPFGYAAIKYTAIVIIVLAISAAERGHRRLSPAHGDARAFEPASELPMEINLLGLLRSWREVGVGR